MDPFGNIMVERSPEGCRFFNTPLEINASIFPLGPYTRLSEFQEVTIMQNLMSYLFLVLMVFAFFLNILGFMQLIPLYITLPLLFISIYLTIFSFTHKHTFRRLR